MSHPFHRLTAPSEWMTTVEAVSFSSLRALERCPRQWQLQRSKWPGFERFPTRPHAAALEGTIAHEVLDRVFREMAFEGLPPLESGAAREVLRRIDVMGAIQRRIDDANEALEHHPRRSALRLPHDARSLYNRVAQLFRREYAGAERADLAPVSLAARGPRAQGDALGALRARGVLTEWPVAHPSLPVRGVIDMLRRDAAGTHIVDFKTGHVRPEYEEQLSLYALLWWRTTGDLPASMSLRHPRGRTVFAVDGPRLIAAEESLSARIAAVREDVGRTPATARAGEHCGTCDVRPFCDDYWRLSSTVEAQRGAGRRSVDLEVCVPDAVEANGFVVSQGKRRLPVVWDDDGTAVHGPFATGETLRITGAIVDGDVVKLTATTEVFHRPATA